MFITKLEETESSSILPVGKRQTKVDDFQYMYRMHNANREKAILNFCTEILQWWYFVLEWVQKHLIFKASPDFRSMTTCPIIIL